MGHWDLRPGLQIVCPNALTTSWSCRSFQPLCQALATLEKTTTPQKFNSSPPKSYLSNGKVILQPPFIRGVWAPGIYLQPIRVHSSSNHSFSSANLLLVSGRGTIAQPPNWKLIFSRILAKPPPLSPMCWVFLHGGSRNPTGSWWHKAGETFRTHGNGSKRISGYYGYYEHVAWWRWNENHPGSMGRLYIYLHWSHKNQL